MALEKKHASKNMVFGEHRDLNQALNIKSSSTHQKRINVNIDDALHRKLKVACGLQGVSISDVVKELIEKWLDETV